MISHQQRVHTLPDLISYSGGGGWGLKKIKKNTQPANDSIAMKLCNLNSLKSTDLTSALHLRCSVFRVRYLRVCRINLGFAMSL